MEHLLALSAIQLFAPCFQPHLPQPKPPGLGHAPCGFPLNEMRRAEVGSWQGQINQDKAICFPRGKPCQQGAGPGFVLGGNFRAPIDGSGSRSRPCRKLLSIHISSLSPSLAVCSDSSSFVFPELLCIFPALLKLFPCHTLVPSTPLLLW